jgi:molecular chaperone DnaK (HSP70)
LVLTVPVESFEKYLKWLKDETQLTQQQQQFDIRRVRIIDESTAAALGYEVRSPGEIILVFDFGGGTLDISLVRMPLADEAKGLVLDAQTPGAGDANVRKSGQFEARVLAKAGRILGGDDVDHWIINEAIARSGQDRSGLADAYGLLKSAAEAAKIRLSTQDTADMHVYDPDTRRTYHATITRTQFEDLLERQEFFAAIHKTFEKVLRQARSKGIFSEDIGAVLMVGGSSMIPSVRRLVRTYFGAQRVFEHKPFEAVAHGALSVAVGLGVDDFLYHSYGIRHLSPITGRHEWEEIIPAGARYPLEEAVRLVLSASRDGQDALELVIGEVEESAGGITEVMFGNRAILMLEGGLELRKVVPLNDDDSSRVVAHLAPPGKAGEDRVEVTFDVDENRTLRVTVADLITAKELLRDIPVIELH